MTADQRLGVFLLAAAAAASVTIAALVVWAARRPGAGRRTELGVLAAVFFAPLLVIPPAGAAPLLVFDWATPTPFRVKVLLGWIGGLVSVWGCLYAAVAVWLIRRRRVVLGAWKKKAAVMAGSILLTVGLIVLLTYTPRPVWMPAAPAGNWFVMAAWYLTACGAGLVGWVAWRLGRARWEVAAMGTPALVADVFAMSLGDQFAGVPPPLRAATELPVRWRFWLPMAAVGPLTLALVWRADDILGPPPPGFESFKLLFAAMGVLIVAQTLVMLTAEVWGVPVGRYLVTAEGLVAGVVILRWADAEAVTLGPAPGTDDGTDDGADDGDELLEVVGPGAFGGVFGARTTRLRVGPAAAPTLRALLADAGVIPAGGPAPAGDVAPDVTG